MNNSTASGATIAQLNKTLGALLRRDRRVFYCHPHVLPLLFNAARQLDDARRRRELLLDGSLPAYSPPIIEQTGEHAYVVGGLPVRTHDLLPKYAKKWEPPPGGRFWEYTASDEAWAAPLGVGRYVDDVSQPVVYAVDPGAVEFAAAGGWDYVKQLVKEPPPPLRTYEWLRSMPLPGC